MTEPIKVKIVKCSMGSAWYCDGETYDVVNDDNNFYRFSPNKTILKSDCEVIEPIVQKEKKNKLKMKPKTLAYFQEMLCNKCSIFKDEENKCKTCIDNLDRYKVKGE